MLSKTWPKQPVIYEINTRVWLREMSARSSRPVTLDKVWDEEIERIARHGVHAIWLMGVWTTGAEPVAIARSIPALQQEYRQALPDYTDADVVGSPYAITAYEVPQAMGGTEGLAAFRERIARHGMRLMLDFVPNHTARDNAWVREKPEIYMPGSVEELARQPGAFFKNAQGQVIAHGRDPYFPPWTDTAQLNYGSSAGRETMLGELLRVARQCDGLRCDMAMLVLPEVMERVWGARMGPDWIRGSFWKEALVRIKQQCPNFLMLAESYWNLDGKLQEEGFDFTYDKTLYDRMRHGDNKGVRQHLQSARKFQECCARFVENHDEPRAVTAFGAARARSAAAVAFFAPGLKLIHEGQLEGRRVRVPVQMGRRQNEGEDVETAIFYEKIFSVLQDPAFQTGEFALRDVRSAGWGDTSHDSLAALSWVPAGPANGQRRHLGYLIVVNLNPWRAYGRVPLPPALYDAAKQYVFHDCLDGKRYERPGGELLNPGLYIALEGHQSHVMEISVK